MKAWTVGFDADDTLWHNERFFRATEARFLELLAEHMEGGDLRARLRAGLPADLPIPFYHERHGRARQELL